MALDHSHDSGKEHQQAKGIGVVGFMIDKRPVVFAQDRGANRRFLESVDTSYWTYQASVHLEQLQSDDSPSRQRAASALRLVYGQGLEALFGWLLALAQAPSFPIGWLGSYRNDELRSAVKKIHSGAGVPSPMRRKPTWLSLAQAVHDHIPVPTAARVTERFAQAWERLASEFLDDTFEPEYNSLKHGMRSQIGGFSVAMSPAHKVGTAPPEMKSIGGSEYGSSFWMPPRKVAGYARTFDFTRYVSRAWVPEQFAHALTLVGISIGNIASRALIEAGKDSTTVKFSWPSDDEAYEAPWRTRPSVSHLSINQSVDLSGWQEPSADEIRARYALPRDSDRKSTTDE